MKARDCPVGPSSCSGWSTCIRLTSSSCSTVVAGGAPALGSLLPSPHPPRNEPSAKTRAIVSKPIHFIESSLLGMAAYSGTWRVGRGGGGRRCGGGGLPGGGGGGD